MLQPQAGSIPQHSVGVLNHPPAPSLAQLASPELQLGELGEAPVQALMSATAPAAMLPLLQLSSVHLLSSFTGASMGLGSAGFDVQQRERDSMDVSIPLQGAGFERNGSMAARNPNEWQPMPAPSPFVERSHGSGLVPAPSFRLSGILQPPQALVHAAAQRWQPDEDASMHAVPPLPDAASTGSHRFARLLQRAGSLAPAGIAASHQQHTTTYSSNSPFAAAAQLEPGMPVSSDTSVHGRTSATGSVQLNTIAERGGDEGASPAQQGEGNGPFARQDPLQLSRTGHTESDVGKQMPLHGHGQEHEGGGLSASRNLWQKAAAGMRAGKAPGLPTIFSQAELSTVLHGEGECVCMLRLIVSSMSWSRRCFAMP